MKQVSVLGKEKGADLSTIYGMYMTYSGCIVLISTAYKNGRLVGERINELRSINKCQKWFAPII